MARGKGRKNESTSKAKVNRDLGKGPAEGRTGGGSREANPYRREPSSRDAAREAAVRAPVLPAGRVAAPGGKKIGGKAGGKSGGGKKAASLRPD